MTIRSLLAPLFPLLTALFPGQDRPARADEPTPPKAVVVDPALVARFEREVRPVLVEHCVSCHGPKKQEMGLRLDSSHGLRKGSDNGPVFVEGDPAQSLLIEAVRYDGDLRMPPKGKLPPEAIAALEQWIKQGAIWPAPSKPEEPAPDLRESARKHWAFQPIRRPAVPTVKTPALVRNEIDAFVLSRLESAGLSLSPPADRRTWLRRVTFDLHGLPPTPEEIDAFEADQSDDPFSTVVDRLLGSPRYGERWGRHWLDVARYSDTKGYVRLNENPRYPSSWTYRDYVIDALNADLPFDQFVREQLAADLLPVDPSNPDRHQASLAAMGFLTLGQRFLNSTPDIIDDRIDVVSRGLLGLSVSCARCHDHKFDPIPTTDYYGLYGVFANSVEPREPPLILPPSQQSKYTSYLAELQSRTERLEEYLHTQHAALTNSMRARAGEYLLAGQYDPIQPNFLAVMFLIDASKDLNPVMVQRWARYLDQSRRRNDPVLTPWNQLADWVNQHKRQSSTEPANEASAPVPADEFRQKLRELIAAWKAAPADSSPVNPVIVEALQQTLPASLADLAKAYGDLLHDSQQRWETARQKDATRATLPDPHWEAIRQLMMGEHSPLTLSLDDVEEFLFVDATTQQQLHAQQRLVTDWIASPDAAPHAMSLEDVEVPVESRVFIRGNASNPGDVVPRQFITVLRGDAPRPFQHGSGRLELAQAIASPANPLTARVIVNRIWMHHFGAGIVRTPSDFGLRGEPPTHPELLDHLASEFIAHGWSLKWLHRQILLSRTYESSSQPVNVEAERSAHTIDPENRLLWRMNRRRLDWEAMRDALLAASGQLDEKRGGPSVDLFSPPYSARRSVYGLVDRQNLASELKAFDFAPPDSSSPQRHETTVPQQALFLMNSPFMKQAVRHLAKTLDAAAAQPQEQRIVAASRLLFGRAATPEEVELVKSYLASDPGQPQESGPDGSPLFLSAWEEYLQALLLSNEFLFVD